MFRLVAYTVIPAFCAVGPAAPVQAQVQGGYIVIAGSDSTRSVETTVGGSLASLSHVEQYALSRCAQRRGATDCRILAEGQGGCVALSDDGPSLVGAWGATRDAADAAAVAKVGLAGANVDVARCVGDPDLTAPPGGGFWTTQ